jgi:hypothetical protein
VTRITSAQSSLNKDSVRIIEKVYLHVDRDIYYPGDDVWFKAYLIDGIDRTLTNHSNNLHVELISPSCKIIATRVIRLESGLGEGDFKLTGDLSSGKYKIRAYTNFMRNFSDQIFFCKDILIVNANDKNEGSTEAVKYVENKIHLIFFPEGGSLLDNTSSIVSFKAVNNLEKGCVVSGRIFSSAGDLITTFKSNHLGMGSFFLRPVPGLSYYSIFRGADSIDTKVDLPKAVSNGINLCASFNQENYLIITTKTNPQTLRLVSEHDLLLSISARNEVVETVKYQIKDPLTNIIIPTDDLPDGILMLTLSTMENFPLSERLVYLERIAPIKIQIQTDKPLYNKREPLTLNISLLSDSNSELNGNISLAVVDKNFTENTSHFPRSIASWFLLESDVRGLVEDPSYYFDPSNPGRLKDLDLLLRTQGWRDFRWKYDKINFSPENGFTISGRLRKYSVDKAIENSRVSIGIFGIGTPYLTTVFTDSSGRFKLSDVNITGESRLIVTGTGKKERLQGILNLDSIFYLPAKVSDTLSPVSIIIENKMSKLKTTYEINESIRKKYKLSDTISLGEVKVSAERHKDAQIVKIESSRILYGKPDNELIITDQFLSYPYLIEILRGHIPGVVVTGTYPDYKVYLRGNGSLTQQGPPLVLIDGRQATFEDLIFMPINAIDRIDVLKQIGSANIYGLRGANGVINLITRTGGWAYVPVKYSKNIKISGYNASRVFYSPQHQDDSNSLYEPDLRSTLFWKPEIELKGPGEVILKYYNSDNSSIVRITAEGITSTGVPVTGCMEYEVR